MQKDLAKVRFVINSEPYAKQLYCVGNVKAAQVIIPGIVNILCINAYQPFTAPNLIY